MKKFLILFFILTMPCFATNDVYRFNTIEKQQQFESLTTQLRCLVCQNQNIAESNAALASDLREQVYQKIQQDQSSQQIVDYLVARYGNYILYQPPFNISTLGLWLSPFIIMFGGISYLIYYLRKKQRD